MRKPFQVGKGLALIVGIFIAIVASLLLLNNLRSQILSAVRAYVAGEGLYSKGQKDAVNHLVRYAHSHAESDYENYLAALAVPLGDRQARLELEQSHPDLKVVYDGFAAAHNHPQDIENMANLFRRFRHVSYMDKAIDFWAHGDALIVQLRQLGDELHALIAAGSSDAERGRHILEEVDVLNERLTEFENGFSRTLGVANRWLERRLRQVTYGATALLLVAGVALSWMILRQVRNADEALRRSEERYRSLVAVTTSVIWTTDAAGAFVAPQPAWEAFTGQGWAEHAREGWLNALHPDDRGSVQTLWTQALAERTIFQAEGRCLHAASGQYRYVVAHAVPLLNGDRSVREWIGTLTDVDDRHRAEQQSGARARQHEATARLGATALSGRDLQSLMDEAAAYVTRTLGTDLCEVLEFMPDGRELILRAGTGWKPGYVGHATVALEHNSHNGYPLASTTPVIIDDLRKQTSFPGAPLLRDHGVVSGLSVVIAGDGVGHSYGVLGSYVTHPRSFTDDEVNFLCAVANVLAVAIQRKRAEEALHEANRQKDDFLAMLAHELRNPLSPIRNAVHVLRRSGPQESSLERARDMIDRQVAHMTRLLDDLLDVSRVARGKISLHRQMVDLAQVVRLAGDDYRATLEAAGLTLSLTLPDQPMWVRGDATRLSQAVGNLLHNASKFTDPGGRVTMTLAAPASARDAVLSVRDTGIGMEPEMVEHVFETFSQADHSLDRSRGGLGLGLALVKGLVELHGGKAEAFSAGIGKGSEFTIRLPLEPDPPRCAATPSSHPAEERLRRVLVIEDNRDVAESMKYLLETEGHQVTVAHTGSAGIEAARQFHPEVVLCDIGLPGGMDGFAVAKVMRNDSALSSAYLIALTGYGQEEDRRKALEAGFDMHLIKPVDPLLLDQVLAKLSGVEV